MLHAGVGEVACLFDAEIQRLDHVAQARRAEARLERYVAEQRHGPPARAWTRAERACQGPG